MQNSREGYGENWMHFVYKLDNLFRSMRVSDEKTHLLHGHFIFLNVLELRTFLRSVCTIQGNVINFQLFLASFAIFHPFTDLFLVKWPWNWKALQMNSENFKLGIVSSFHPHSMCKKVERVTTKTGCTSCTKWTIYFEVSRFGRKVINYKAFSFF